MKFRQLELFGEETSVREVSPVPVPEPEFVPVTESVPASEAAKISVMHVEAAPPDPPPVPQTSPEVEFAGITAPTALKRSRRQSRHAVRESFAIELPPDEVLYTRQYYGIGEVAAMFQVKVSVLRYWESEFDILDLRKNRKGDRFFRPDDIKTVRLIYHLLRERRFTIEGAREYIRQNTRGRERVEAIETLRRIRSFLVGIRESLVSRSPSA
ncbi:MAG: MerR family transcriptional regulator [Chitinophagia bacterium]|nr:MerR family transcriptional regulator [Chitinophagia bacterium]